NAGVIQRDILHGEIIGTKQQFIVNEGQFLMSKIDARNGAFGIVPKELEGAIVTNDFPAFEVNKEIINAAFLVLITTTKEFVKFAQSCSSGTTNRQRIDIPSFLNVKIPLPTLEEQNQIVQACNTRIIEAKRLEEEAKSLEVGIEEYLFELLGIVKLEVKTDVLGLQLLRFKNIDRWDMLAKDLRILNSLSVSKYSLKKLGDIFSFPKRPWKKDFSKDKTFKYIELGCVDPLIGITESKTVKVNEAPSRATQIVKTNDLIIGTTRPYLKRFATVTEKFNLNICSSGFTIIESKEIYNLNYLKEFLMSYYGIEQLKNKMTGALYPAITESAIKEILIPFPTLTIQNQITEKINEMKKLATFNIKQAELFRQLAISEFESKIFMP
ncbi:MAG: restriction endonuclease subunit S, partial [Bacteroidota bacterium]|nr:restriction endonuclease subunit S [Bacteroidota bacterium]